MTYLNQEWDKNLTEIEGKYGARAPQHCDGKSILARITQVLKDDLYSLPADLDNPETQEEVDAVNKFAGDLYDLFCEGAEKSENMMVGDQVQKKYEDMLDETGQTQSYSDKMREYCLKEGDF